MSHDFGEIAFRLGIISDEQYRHLSRYVADHPDVQVADYVRSLGWVDGEQLERIRDWLESEAQKEKSADTTRIEISSDLTTVPESSLMFIEELGCGAESIAIDGDKSDDTNDGDFELSEGLVRSSGDFMPFAEGLRYRRGEVFAEGGLSRVWVVYDSQIKRNVALKQIRKELAANRAAQVRFRREAQITGQLEHPNIVPVYEFSNSDEPDKLYYTMRLVEGATLLDAIEDFHRNQLPRSKRRVAQLNLLQAFIAVCQAVAYAHSRGIIHRDIKPANIVLGNFGEVILLDWGLAKVLHENEPGAKDESPHDGFGTSSESSVRRLSLDSSASGDATRVDAVLGTPNYMAPEQVSSTLGPIHEATDVFALGGTLFMILTGRPPRHGLSTPEAIAHARTQSIPAPRSIRKDIARPLNAICVKALARHPKDRYQSAMELADDVKHFMADEPVTAWREPLWLTMRRWITRNRVMVSSITALLFAVTVASLLGNVMLNRANRAIELARLETQLLACEMTYNRGLLLCKQGQIGNGLLWFSRCLEQLPENSTDLERVLRRSIASWSTRLNPMERIIKTRADMIAIEYFDDHRLMIASATDGIEIRDAWSGDLLFEPIRLEQKLIMAGLVQGGQHLWTVDVNNAVFVWHLNGQKVCGPMTVRERIDTVATSLTADRLFVGCEDGQGYLWSLSEAKLVSSNIRHRTQILSCHFSPVGNYYCVGDASHVARLYSAKHGTVLSRELQHSGWVTSVTFAPDNRWFATATNQRQACLWNIAQCIDALQREREESVASGTDVRPHSEFLHQGDVRFVEFSHDGSKLMTGSSDNSVRVWNIASKTEICPPLKQLGVPRQAYFLPDDTHVVTGGSDNVLRIWNYNTGLPVGSQISLGSGLTAFSLNPSGTQVATLEQNGRVTTWSLNLADDSLVLQHDRPVYKAVYHPEQNLLATGTAGQADTIRLWDTKSGNFLGSIPNAGFTFTLAFDGRGEFLASGGTQSWVRFWDINERTENRPAIAGSSPIAGLAVSSDQKYLARIAWDNWLRVSTLDSTVTEPEMAILLPGGRQIAFQPNSHRIAIGCQDGLIQIWSLPFGSKADVTISNADQVRQIQFSPDGRLLAAASRDRFVRLWDSQTGRAVGAPMLHDAAVNAIAFSPDGKLLATGCDDGIARLWDVVERKEVAAPMKHEGSVLSVAFRPDGQQIATTSNDNTVRLWQIWQPTEDAFEGITLRIQKLTGSCIDEFGNTRSLTESEWKSLQQRFFPTIETSP